jgi:outer membrane protein TolC
MTTILPFIVLILSGLAPASDSLSLEDCLRMAGDNNPKAFLSANAIQSADLARQELKSQSRPQVKFKGDLEYAPAGKGFGYDPALTNRGQIGSQVVVEQTLYDGGQRSIKARQADLQWTRSRHEQKLAMLDLKFEVTQAFTEVLRLREDLELKRAGVERLRDYSGLVGRMHTGGQAGFTDVLKTRIQVSEAESAVKQAAADLQGAKYALAELLGSEGKEAVEIKGNLDSTENPTPLDTAGNVDWEIAELESQNAELEVAASRGEWKPTVAASADMGLLTSFDNLEAPSKDRAGMLGASVGLHVDMPIFSWGLRANHMRQSRLAAENAEWQWKSQRRSLLMDHQKTWLQWEAARDHRDALRGDLAAARDNFLLTKSKYAGGSGLASEVLDAQKLWVDTQSSLIQAEADLVNLGARLKRLEAH